MGYGLYGLPSMAVDDVFVPYGSVQQCGTEEERGGRELMGPTST